MGRIPGNADDPLGINSTLRISAFLPELHAIGIADPLQTDNAHLNRVEEQLRSGKVKALKGYLGYLYYGPESPNYAPYYELAAQFQIPFIFHTGDNYSIIAKLKYAQPLLVDEVAVEHPDVNFVLAHFGNPWITDAAEVIYKNDNVWADLSGLLVGDEVFFERLSEDGTLRRVIERVKEGIEFTSRHDRILYGTDWPLVPMRVYGDFVRQIVPEEYHQLVFRENAKALFKL
jgi:hypothetical protein